MIILHNNKLVADAKVSITGAVGRGYGVFETLRTYGNKKLPLAEHHVDRLFVSAGKIGLKIKYSKNDILRMVRKVVNRSSHKLQRIKIIASPNDLVVFSVKAEIVPTIYNGVALRSMKMTRSLPEIKSISYLPSFLAHESALKNGFFDALLVDDFGFVTEGAYSNVFWFDGDNLCTRKDGVFPGMIRDILIKISPYKIKFKNIKLADLKKKGEVFITQSINLIVPVIKIDDKKIGRGVVGSKTQKIMEKFDDFIGTN